MTKKDEEFIMKFMQITFAKINASLSSIYAIKQVLIESGAITSEQLAMKIKEAEQLPERITNMTTLNQMIQEFNTKS